MSLAGFVALQKTEPQILKRLADLQARLDAADASAWGDFLATIQTLAALATCVAPESRGALLTTEEMAARMGISPKTLLRRKAQGDIQPTLQKGKLVRWSGTERIR